MQSCDPDPLEHWNTSPCCVASPFWCRHRSCASWDATTKCLGLTSRVVSNKFQKYSGSFVSQAKHHKHLCTPVLVVKIEDYGRTIRSCPDGKESAGPSLCKRPKHLVKNDALPQMPPWSFCDTSKAWVLAFGGTNESLGFWPSVAQMKALLAFGGTYESLGVLAFGGTDESLGVWPSVAQTKALGFWPSVAQTKALGKLLIPRFDMGLRCLKVENGSEPQNDLLLWLHFGATCCSQQQIAKTKVNCCRRHEN